MFRIQDLTITSALGDDMFPRIFYEDQSVSDEALEAVARILLAKRGFDLTIKDHALVTPENASVAVIKDRIDAEIPIEQDELMLVEVERNPDTVFGCLESGVFADGFVFVKPVAEYLKKRLSSNWAAFICNPERHTSLVFVDVLNIEALHTIASILPAIVPWAFKAMPRTKEEEEVLMALGDFTSRIDDITDKLERLTEYYNLEDHAADFYLDGFNSLVRKSQIEDMKKRIKDLAEEIENLHTNMRICIQNRYKAQKYLMGLEVSDSGDESLIEYFKGNNKLHVVNRNGEYITYIVAGYMDLFDTEVYESIRKTKNSYLYDAYNTIKEPLLSLEDYLLLMDALFQNESVRLKMCSAWKLSPYEIECRGGYRFPTKYEDYFPNSHLQNYNCYGSFKETLDKAIADRDYEYAVDISSAENGNINLCDSIVIPESFIPNLLKSTKRIIELPDGKSVTTVEAVQWIKEVYNGEVN